MPWKSRRTQLNSNSFQFCAILTSCALIQIILLSNNFYCTEDEANSTPIFDIQESRQSITTPYSHEQNNPSDANFMGHPIYHRPSSQLKSFHSTVHCIGDNFIQKDSWKHKTCQFQNLCFDMKSNDFVLFESSEHSQLDQHLSNSSLEYFSAESSFLNNVSIGGINKKWYIGATEMRWFPKVLNAEETLSVSSEKEDGVYLLPEDVVMVPFHSFAGFNPGHLLWDDWLPLYSILETFDYLEKNPLFIRYILKEALWATCDLHKQVKHCAKMMSKFLPLLGIGNLNSKNNTLYTINDFNFTVNHDAEGKDLSVKSRYVCAKNGAAGLGSQTDHGIGDKLHGWLKKDYERSHNSNRAASLYRFRNFMMNNIGVSTAPLHQVTQNKKFKIIFSINSSSSPNRKTDFNEHIKRLQKSGLEQKYNIEILSLTLRNL